MTGVLSHKQFSGTVPTTPPAIQGDSSDAQSWYGQNLYTKHQ